MPTAPTSNFVNHASAPVGAGAAAPPDPQLVADMKQEIRALVQEVSQLAAQDIAPAEFYAGFLARVVAAMAAAGGAVWTVAENGQLKLQHQVKLQATGAESPQSRTRHAQLLKHVLAGSQAVLVPPSSGALGSTQVGNPTDFLLVLAPLIVENEPAGVVEIFQRTGGAPSTQRGYLRFLVQMCDVACDYLKSRRLRQLADSQSLWRQLEELVAALHQSLDVEATAYTIVNEARRTIGCDRVSLALSYGGRCRIEAVSGLDSIDRRATEVQHLANLATAVLKTGEPLWSEEGDDELAPQLQRPLLEYIDRAHTRLLGAVPLVPGSLDQAVSARGVTDTRDERRKSRPIGVLIVEQLSESRASESVRMRTAVVARHSAAALANAIEHSSLFMLPVWKAVGKATWLLRGRALLKTFAALAILGGALAALCLVPTKFEIAAHGKLQPAERREIFAPLDGVVAKVPVEHGQLVERGALLAELTNTELDLQFAVLIGRQTTNQERLAAVQWASLDTRSGAARLAPADENRLAGEVLALRQEAQNIDREIALIREKQQQLNVTAPAAGQVVTWKVRELLLQRPVSRGQALLTLANPDGPWELELYLPERRLKHVHADRTSETSEADVTFTLSSHPGQAFPGRIVEIERVAEVRGDEGNTVLVRVAVEKEKLPPLHDQTTVTAKLDCGRTSIGYAWFCDLIETVQSKALFWLPG